GGGAVVLTIARDLRGERVVATATDVGLAVGGSDLGMVTASLDMAAAGPADGALLASWRADLGGRAVAAQMDASLDPDGWQAFITGQDDLGTSVEGAVVLSDGRVQGSLTAVDVAGLPLSAGARVSVAASGPVAAPAITVRVAGDAPVTLALGPPELVLIDVLSGSVTGTLDGTALPDLSGAFRPVTVSGELDMSPVTAELNLTLAE